MRTMLSSSAFVNSCCWDIANNLNTDRGRSEAKRAIFSLIQLSRNQRLQPLLIVRKNQCVDSDTDSACFSYISSDDGVKCAKGTVF